MVLQSSGKIFLSNIQTEFGGTNPILLSEYYLNGLYAKGTGATGIPTSGKISLSNFYGKSKTLADAITTFGANLVLRHDGMNIDGTNNSTLTVGGVIGSWHNSGNSTSLTTTQTDNGRRPIYTSNGAVFSNGKVLISNINLNNYSTMNIFVVWKKTANSSTLKWLWSQDNGGYDRTLIIINDYALYVGRGDGAAEQPSYSFPINTTVVVNCEYNSSGLNGAFYINNNILVNFSSLGVSGTAQTFFGSIGADASYTSSGSATVDGIIYEIIIIDRLLTSTERTNIYTTLNTKWMV
jgi:hypothetical protein